MKRSELTVGAELAWSRSEAWDTPERVVVVAVEPHIRVERWRRRADGLPFAVSDKGNGVLVDKPNFQGHVQKEVVQLAQLRGPWAEYKAAWDARKEAQRTQDRQLQERRNETDGRATALVAALAVAGVQARATYSYGETRIALGLDEAQKVVDLLNDLYESQ
jgi:hypothetical protein